MPTTSNGVIGLPLPQLSARRRKNDNFHRLRSPRPIAAFGCCCAALLSSCGPTARAHRASFLAPPSPPLAAAAAILLRQPPAFSSSPSPSSGSGRFFRRDMKTPSSVTAAAAAMSTSSTILDSPSAERNKGPIWSVLSSEVLPALLEWYDDRRHGDGPKARIVALETAAGCGVHTMHFASNLSRRLGGGGGGDADLRWFPTDPDPLCLASIRGRIERAEKTDSSVRSSVAEPTPLALGAEGIDGGGAASSLPDDGTVDLVICVNMIHISPWSATIGLMKVSREKLRKGGFLYCYGPYKVDGGAVESNLNFDRSLRSRNPSWGVRNLEDVQKVAEENGLTFVKTVDMPANNLSVIFRKS